MRDKRTVDELSIEELERILVVKRRQERQGKLERMKRSGRMVEEPGNGKKQHPPIASILAAQQPEPSPVKKPQSKRSPANSSAAPHFEDDPDTLPELDQDRNRFWKRFVNQSLLLVEIAAVLGLVYLGYTLLQSIGSLERETAEAQRLADAAARRRHADHCSDPGAAHRKRRPAQRSYPAQF